MNSSLQTKIENDYDSRDNKMQTELELSFGIYTYPHRKFEASIPENIYNELQKTLLKTLKTPKSSSATKSIIYSKTSDPKQQYELFINDKNDVTLHLKRDKTDKNKYDIQEASARVSIATEITKQIKTKSDKNSNPLMTKNLSFIRYKDRQSYVYKEYPNWQFDFTTGFQSVPNKKQTITSLITEYNKSGFALETDIAIFPFSSGKPS